MKTFYKGALVGGLAAAVVLLATAAIAGTGVGGIFNLGQTNTVNAPSSLKGSTHAQNLRITNTGSGSALALKVGSGHPPMTVNSRRQGREAECRQARWSEREQPAARICTNGRRQTKGDSRG